LDGKIQTHSSRASSEHETVEPGSIKKRDEEIHRDARKNSINLNQQKLYLQIAKEYSDSDPTVSVIPPHSAAEDQKRNFLVDKKPSNLDNLMI
jgi:hypothetical protein